MKQILIISAILLVISCGSRQKPQNPNQNQDTIYDLPVIDTTQALVVNENCVIFLWPDSAEIARLQADNDEETYNAIVDDMTWYPGLAMEVLDSFNIKSLSSSKEFIILRNAQKKDTKLTRKEIEGNMILFRIDKEPIIAYAIDFNKDFSVKFFNE